MNSKQFCFYLKGCFDMAGDQEFSPKQIDTIKKELYSIFEHSVISPVTESIKKEVVTHHSKDDVRRLC